MTAPTTYTIEVHGRVPSSLGPELESFAITTTSDTTVLVGNIIDGAALYGLLARFEALGVRLVSLKPTEAQ